MDPSGHGAYCGDDYDPGCLSDEEYAKYVQMGGEERSQAGEFFVDDSNTAGDDQVETLWDDSWNEFHCDNCFGQYVKYYTFSGGTAIPNPITGTVIGWHFSLSLDQYGEVYFGLGLDAGKNVLGWSVNLIEGRFASDQLPVKVLNERQFLEDFLTGNSVQGYLVPIFYIGANWSISTGLWSSEQGIGSPQGGVCWTYSWKVSK